MIEKKKKLTIEDLQVLQDKYGEENVELLPSGEVLVPSMSKQEEGDGSRAFIQHTHIKIKFQLGPINEFGHNGAQIDEVIQVLVKRLEGFQRGKFKCRENAVAITKLQEAVHWLEHRTRDRERRGVEGKNIE